MPNGSAAACARGLVIAALLLLAPGAVLAQPAPRGWQRVELPGAGSYTLDYVPFSLDLAQAAPAVVFLHGSGLGPEYWQQQTSLAQVAEQLGFVLIVPRAAESLNFGIGADEMVIAEALGAARQRLAIDARRIGLAGFSAGAAYALVLAYVEPAGWSGVFAMAAPYRTVIALANPSRPPPIRFSYGSADPNYQNGHHQALHAMFDRLGVPNELELVPGLQHQVPPDASLLAGFGFLLAQPLPSCVPSATAMCLRGRFRVSARWQTAAAQGDAGVVQLTDESGYLWFFSPANVEVSLKLIDACTFNQRYWVYAAGTTDVRVVLTVTDTAGTGGGGEVSYVSPLGTPFQPVLDSDAFATCP